MEKEAEEFKKCINRAWDLFLESNLADTKLFGEAVDRFGELCKSTAKEIKVVKE